MFVFDFFGVVNTLVKVLMTFLFYDLNLQKGGGVYTLMNENPLISKKRFKYAATSPAAAPNFDWS